ncbi:SDR family NAD(P)-dependent oxidoreductase [Radicibacter daui]|uniref:SDR family NAD(P)-dependent oxidoreductase n=1 Tax=Radicibacter daui TaxID=3064829 RepID=UPI004046CB9A
MKVLVTGAAGFIGYHTAEALIARGDEVVGIDNINDYYDVDLKKARLERLKRHKTFEFRRMNIADAAQVEDLAATQPDFDGIVHLAAQAGVRYSLTNPLAYVEANLTGHLLMLELARRQSRLKHMVYASSSSVYGGNTKQPFSVDDPVERPVSLYAATKRADELISYSYAHIHRTPLTGLRFFTVYGPWGRPDMALYIFTRAIVAGKPIDVFNNGEMWRDFTYIDDIVSGLIAALDRPPAGSETEPPHRVYNLGNHRAEKLTDLIDTLEAELGLPAIRQLKPMQPGDVPSTYADIESSRQDLDFEPKTNLAEGIRRFVAWFRQYHGNLPAS